jgi:glycine/D-amino acid oxidase-like deaminating enzyme
VSSPDAAVVGAGTFGAWTAWHLRKAGLSVALVDAYGSGNTRASSGGETRVIRMGYGADEAYTRWAQRSLAAWKELSRGAELPLFHATGVLWMGRADEPYMEATLAAFRAAGIRHEPFGREELVRRYPQIEPGPIERGIFEPEGGALLARRGIQLVARRAEEAGVRRIDAAAEAPAGGGRLESIRLSPGERLSAGIFVFACGPWLGKIFPDLLGDRIFVTRQEIVYLGPAPGDRRFAPPAMPVWLDLTEEMYGIPDLEGRGFKLAVDVHGPRFDPDSGSREASAEGIAAVRAYAGRRFPALAAAPTLAAEVCQYENTSNGDFLLDRHPDFENVWLAGGGSGHGFKHGPAIGEYLTERILRGGEIESRFRLETKEKRPDRRVH